MERNLIALDAETMSVKTFMNEDLKTGVGPAGDDIKTSVHREKESIKIRPLKQITERLQCSEPEPEGEDLSK